jgi:two-component system response regulator PilR (NtrC family)
MEHNDSLCAILIVDDDKDLCRLAAAILKGICTVHIEHTLRNAEIYLTREKTNLILLDNNLPDGSGVDAIKGMLRAYPGMKIVLMTADLSPGLKDQAIREGAAEFLAKPFPPSLMNNVITSLYSGPGV